MIPQRLSRCNSIRHAQVCLKQHGLCVRRHNYSMSVHNRHHNIIIRQLVSRSMGGHQYQHHHHTLFRRLNTSDAAVAANFSIHPNVYKHQRSPQKSSTKMLEITQRLLSKSQPKSSSRYPLRDFEQILANTREDRFLLKKMQLSHDEARKMYILPPQLLRDVHNAIMHFANANNFQGMAMMNNEDFGNNKKIPGPIICARLLELIGIPQYYLHVSLSSLQNSTNISGPTMYVHSSQIDTLLECCVETTTALSRSCEMGKYSLLGNNFDGPVSFALDGSSKSAAQFCEEIWRSIWNVEIKYTSGKRTSNNNQEMQHLPQEVRIGRVGNIINTSPIVEYLSTMHDKNKEDEDDECEFFDELSGTKWEKLTPEKKVPWSVKDQRRYDKSIVLFNSVLAAYAKLSSSVSGMRGEARREMVLSAERLLLEVAQKEDTEEPSPSTILQCIQPDVISFNTTMKAWSGLYPKQRQARESRSQLYKKDDGSGTDDEMNMGSTNETVKRTESILEIMQVLWDEERSCRTTLQSIEAAWKERVGHNAQIDRHAPPPRHRVIAPNSSSYTSVLKALSRNVADPDTSLSALKLYQTMIDRSNRACLARKSLVADDSEQYHLETKSHMSAQDPLPDSRTYTLLNQCLQNLSSNIGFRDAFDTVDSIFKSMKQLDEQLEWSAQNLNRGSKPRSPILNVYTYNQLIKTLSNIDMHSWEERFECCLRIEDIVDEASHLTVRPNAITAWSKCADHAGGDEERLRLCAKKCGNHIDILIMDLMQSKGNSNSFGSYVIQAVNNTMALYGKAGMTLEADELYLRAKSCGNSAHNLATLSTIVDALCSSQNITDVDKAKQHLFDFEQEQMQRSNPPLPDMRYTYIYNNLIEGYVNCGTKEGLEQADAILSHMISSHGSNPRHIARPNTTSFAKVMAALSQTPGGSIQRLEVLLSKMDELNQRRKSAHRSESELVANVFPNNVIYNILLKAYKNTKDASSAMKLLGKMEADPDIRPDNVTNSYIMDIISETPAISEDEKDTSPSLTTKIGIESVNQNPTAKSFHTIIKDNAATGNVKDVERGEELLRKLEDMYRTGESSFKPDIFLYNKLMNAWRLCLEQTNDEDEVNSTIPAERAQAILDSICEQHEAGGEDSLSPNDVSFSLCIHTWVKSNQPERAEQILRRKMKFAESNPEQEKKYSQVQVKPSDYNPIIQRFKGHDNGPERATHLFEEMVQKYTSEENPELKPNVSTLNSLLDVYAKCKSRDMGSQAQRVLNRMNQLYKEGKVCILPDVISYRSVIDAWIRMWDPVGPQRVDALVNEMIDKYNHEGREDLCPDTNAFNLVLKACAQAPAMYDKKGTNDKGHPIAIANRIFSTLKRKNEYGATATHATYSFLFHIYRQHMDFHDERYAPLMLNLWKACCREGLVSDFTLKSFRDSVLPPDFWKAIGGKDRYKQLGKTTTDKITIKDLPKEWTANVSGQRPKKK